MSRLAGLRLGRQSNPGQAILTASWGLIKTLYGFQHVVHIKKAREAK